MSFTPVWSRSSEVWRLQTHLVRSLEHVDSAQKSALLEKLRGTLDENSQQQAKVGTKDEVEEQKISLALTSAYASYSKSFPVALPGKELI
ncbi:MAG: hypothetical protein HQL31_11140, partial [Planctomycetes bacterium]|nr:hypothetical protein [Planctomycetota bacterium]